VDFTLFFQEIGIDRDRALEISQRILMGIHKAIIKESDRQGGKLARLRRADEFGFKLIRGSNAVKKYYMLPRGSRDEVLYRGKMWLQFEVEVS
jgi:hypothetical protein